MSWFAADDAPVRVSADLAALLEQADAFASRPRRPPVEEDEPPLISWRAPGESG